MLLDGGNREVQKSVYHFFINHTSSEMLFLRLHNRFDEDCINLKKEDEDDNTVVTYLFQERPDEIANTLRFL
jgi:hypothetical protein